MADKKPNAIVKYYHETVGELRKVSWPTREEAINLTIIVVVVMIAMSIFLGLMDVIGQRLLTIALDLSR